jgi:hypothetical protein
MKRVHLLIPVLFLLLLSGCKDEKSDPAPLPQAGIVQFIISNKAGSADVDINTPVTYSNMAGENFQVNLLKYYVSNVELLEGTEVKYTVPESYFLVDQSKPESRILQIPDVPAGSYTGVRFLLGVDSTRNVSGSQTGALDPANGMFWTWNTGYIFFKLEGSSPASSNGELIYHIGGFSEIMKTNAIRRHEVSFNGNALAVNGSKEAKVFLKADILKLFEGSPLMDDDILISKLSFQMAQGGKALDLADNATYMFSFDKMENN